MRALVYKPASHPPPHKRISMATTTTTTLTHFNADIMSSIVHHLHSYPEVTRLVATCKWMRKTVSKSDVEEAKQRTKDLLGRVEIVDAPPYFLVDGSCFESTVRIFSLEEERGALVIGKAVGIWNPDYVTVRWNGVQLTLNVQRSRCGRRPSNIVRDLVRFIKNGSEAKAWFRILTRADNGIWIEVMFYGSKFTTNARGDCPSFERPSSFVFKFEEQNLL